MNFSGSDVYKSNRAILFVDEGKAYIYILHTHIYIHIHIKVYAYILNFRNNKNPILMIHQVQRTH